MTATTFGRGGRGRRLAGLSGLLAGVGLVVAARATFGQPATQVSLQPARAPLPAAMPSVAPNAAPAPAPSGQPGPAVPPAASAPTARRTVDGSVVDTPYGPVQVAVVFDSGKIADLQALQTPSDANRSIRLAELATPILRQEVLSAQSAQVDSVSGATYTSQGYAQSVQYAIDHSKS